MHKLIISTLPFITLLLTPCLSAANPDGLITKASNYTVNETINRLENILKKKGITIVTRWSHSERAASAGIQLRPTELLLFGNPKLGSHLFTSKQTSGIDLPMKALAWEDKNGKVWLSYNDPAYITKRHNITERKKIENKMTEALNKLTNIAVGK